MTKFGQTIFGQCKVWQLWRGLSKTICGQIDKSDQNRSLNVLNKFLLFLMCFLFRSKILFFFHTSFLFFVFCFFLSFFLFVLFSIFCYFALFPGPPKISLFFFPSPTPIPSFFSLSLGVFSMNFGCVSSSGTHKCAATSGIADVCVLPQRRTVKRSPCSSVVSGDVPRASSANGARTEKNFAVFATKGTPIPDEVWVEYTFIQRRFHPTSRVGPQRVKHPNPEKWGGPKGGGPFFSRHNVYSFFPLLGLFSWNCGGVFKRQDPQMCAFGLVGLSCEAPAAPSWAGAGLSCRSGGCSGFA